MGEWRVLFFFESVYWRFVLDISKSGKFQSTVKDKATIDVYGVYSYTLWHFVDLVSAK